MKSYLALILLSVLLATAARAQSSLFYEGFENPPVSAELPVPGWTVSSSVAGVASWASMDSGFGGLLPRSGGKMGYCAGSKYATNRQAQSPTYDFNMETILQRGLNLQGYRAATLTFWYRIPSIELGYDRLIVRVDGTDVLNVSAAVAQWTQATVNLAPYLGSGHTLTFLFSSDGSVTGRGAFLDDIEVTGTPALEQTVFGPQNPGGESPTDSLVQLDRPSVNTETFNFQSVKTRQVSLVSPGTLVIQQGHANGLFSAYFNGSTDIRDMEIMAETLEINSPLVLKGTNLKIYARNLKFGAAGKITTTPVEKTARAADATGAGSGAKGGNGDAGLPAGNVEVYVSTYSAPDTTPRFVLTGGKGQDAGRGRHGTDGTRLAYAVPTYTRGAYSGGDPVTATPPSGYLITRIRDWQFGGSTITLKGVDAWPSDGTDAWQPGTPGVGGSAGSFSTNIADIPASALGLSGGAAGLPGSPSPLGTHTSTTTCEGGAAGYPLNSIQYIYNLYFGWFTPEVVEEARHTARAGSGVSVPTASAGPGRQPPVPSANPWAWLHPVMLKQLLNKAKDDYLNGNTTAAAAVLRDYAGVLGAYKTSNRWAGAPFKLELSEIYDEMRILLQQVASGLDYFGNPNGWVPMLSFEINASAFDQEIDRSLDIIYLARWISSKQDNAASIVSAMTTARNKLAAEIADAYIKYGDARDDLADLQSTAADITTKTANLLLELEAKDNELTARATQLAQPEGWEIGLRVGLKTAGTICKMIPVYQPALGSVGDVANLGSNFDLDKPWDTISGGLDIASTALQARAQQAADDQASEIANASLTPAQLAAQNATGARTNRLNNMANAASALSGGITDISSYMEATKAPQEKIDAELEKLKSADPSYGALTERIKAITELRRDYADQLSRAASTAASLYDVITRNILAMEALDKTTGANAKVIDAKANAYLKDMERRATDRLLKYHYYMAKAYEYRLLRRYTGTLNLTPLYNKVSEIATAPAANSDGSITDGQRNAMKAVFRDILASVTQTIITEYNSNASNLGTSKTFNLTLDQIAALNRGEAIRLNLVEQGLFLSGEENIRIIDIKAFSPGGIQTSGAYDPGSAAIKLNIEHSGISNLKRNGDVYQFRHYNQETRELIRWTSQYEPNPDILSPTSPSPTASLLRAVIPAIAPADINMFSRPAAWADLKVWREGNNGLVEFGLGSITAPINLTSVRFQVSYDYSPRAMSPAVWNLEVVPATAGTTNPVPDASLSPEFTVSRADRNARQNGTGRFLRLYDNSSTAVVVTAPASYGTLRFVKWVDAAGATLGTNTAYSATPSSDIKLFSIYEPATPVITSALTVAGAVEVPLTYTITATNSPGVFSASGLPTGLQIDAATGVITGTPRVGGAFLVRIGAANSFGPGGEVTLTLTISGTGTTGAVTTLTGSSGQHHEPSYPIAVARWFKWTAPSSGNLTVDTLGSNLDTVLEAFEGTDAAHLVRFAYNDDIEVNVILQSKLILPVTAGKTYWIAVDGYDAGSINAANGFFLNYNLTNGADFAVTQVENGPLTVVDQKGNADTLQITQPAAGQILFSAAGRTFSVNGGLLLGGGSGSISLAGITSITVDTGDSFDAIQFGTMSGLPALTVNGGRGDDSVTFAGSVTLASGALNVDLQDDATTPGTDSVILNGGALVTAGPFSDLTIRCSRSVFLQGGAKLETTGIGHLTVEANQQSTPTAGAFNGVQLDGGAVLKAGSGDLIVKGRGGNASGGYQFGVSVGGGARIAGGAWVEVSGFGGGGSGIVNRAVSLDGTNAEISSEDHLTVNGIASPEGGGFGIGLSVINGGFLSAPTIQVNATGNGAPGTGGNFGMEIGGAGSRITGNSELRGVGGPGGGPGISLGNNGLVQGATIYLIPDSLSLDATGSVTASSVVSIRPASPAAHIELGGNDSEGVLGLSDAKLDRITAPELKIEDYNQPVQIVAPITRSTPGNVSLQAPQGWIASAPGADISLASGGLLRVIEGALRMPITGADADSGFPQVRVNGAVTLEPVPGSAGVSTLDLGGTTHAGTSGQIFRVIDNDGTDAVVGTFAGLPQGSTLPWPGNAQFRARISYTGGTGNDVTLTLELAPGYGLWASTNIPAGQDASFSGDANGDGISNGMAYVFGTTRLHMRALGIVNAPPAALPADINLYLDYTEDLTSWLPLGSWVNGGAPIFLDGVSLNGNDIVDTYVAPRGKAWYRYRVELR